MDKYYKILNIENNSSNDDIRKAYLKMALKYHPDRHTDDKPFYEDKFKEIGAAYDILYNKKDIKNKKNEFEIFRDIFDSMFPNIQITKETLDSMTDIYSKICDNNLDMSTIINVFSKSQLTNQLITFFGNQITTKYKNAKANDLVINKVISLKEQFEKNEYTIEVNLEKRSRFTNNQLIKYKEFFIVDLLNQTNVFKSKGNYNLIDEYRGDLIVNIIDDDKLFKRYKDFDLLYNLSISKDDYLTEIYHIIEHFKRKINIYIDSPYKNNIYILKNEGMVDYSDGYRGDLYINLIMNPDINDSKIKLENCKIPCPVNIFEWKYTI